MEVVRHVASLLGSSGWIVAPGRFDGVHIGHQAVLRRLVEVARARSAKALVLSLRERGDGALGCLRQRVEQLDGCGIDALCLPRASSRKRDPQHLLETLPIELPIEGLVAGAVAAPGFAPMLARRGRIEAVPMVRVDGEIVTSAAVRLEIARGDLINAARRLGRPYAVAGRVVPGLRRGRQLGFPTANVRVKGLQLPPNGVYAVRFALGARVFNGVANLGFNPTFANAERTLETYVFDFDEDIYGRHAEVVFVAFLRGERKFAGVEALIEQIRRDCVAARRQLS